MCRWLTYCGDPIYLDKVLFEPRNSLISQSLRARHSHVTTNGDGFGIGWYGERPTPGVYRDILPAWNDQNLKSLAHQIRSGLFLAHVRASTGTATSRANCHPFAHGKWLFMHNGQIGGYERVRRRLEGMIDDRLLLPSRRHHRQRAHLLHAVQRRAGNRSDRRADPHHRQDRAAGARRRGQRAVQVHLRAQRRRMPSMPCAIPPTMCRRPCFTGSAAIMSW